MENVWVKTFNSETVDKPFEVKFLKNWSYQEIFIEHILSAGRGLGLISQKWWMKQKGWAEQKEQENLPASKGMDHFYESAKALYLMPS